MTSYASIFTIIGLFEKKRACYINMNIFELYTLKNNLCCWSASSHKAVVCLTEEKLNRIYLWDISEQGLDTCDKLPWLCEC